MLAVDQPINKISFCSPDPNNPRIFSYIARDGVTRRWMCHVFVAVKGLTVSACCCAFNGTCHMHAAKLACSVQCCCSFQLKDRHYLQTYLLVRLYITIRYDP